jgi:hypothetical protein
MDTLTYSERCELAATHQGLDLVAAALTPDYDFEILNAGGYCMALVVDAIGGAIVVTGWDTEPGRVHIGAYAGTRWIDGDMPTRFVEDVAIDDVFDAVGRLADALGTEAAK